MNCEQEDAKRLSEGQKGLSEKSKNKSCPRLFEESYVSLSNEWVTMDIKVSTCL